MIFFVYLGKLRFPDVALIFCLNSRPAAWGSLEMADPAT